MTKKRSTKQPAPGRKARGRPVAYYTWCMAYVAAGVRRRRAVTTERAVSAAIHIMRRAFEIDAEKAPHFSAVAAHMSAHISAVAVTKHLQEIENGRKSIPEFAAYMSTDAFRDAVDGALAYLDRA